MEGEMEARIDFPIHIQYHVLLHDPSSIRSKDANDTNFSTLTIITHEAIHEGALIEVHLKLANSIDHLYLVGKVLAQYKRENGNDIQYITRISFENLNSKIRDELFHFMFKKIHESIDQI